MKDDAIPSYSEFTFEYYTFLNKYYFKENILFNIYLFFVHYHDMIHADPSLSAPEPSFPTILRY